MLGYNGPSRLYAMNNICLPIKRLNNIMLTTTPDVMCVREFIIPSEFLLVQMINVQ